MYQIWHSRIYRVNNLHALLYEVFWSGTGSDPPLIAIITISTEWFSILGCANPGLGFALRWMLVQGVCVCVGGRPASACVCGDGHEGSVCGGRRGMCSCLRPYELCPNITRIHHRPEPNPYMPSNHLWHHMSWERDSPFTKHAELFPTAWKFLTIINMQITCTLMRT